MLRSAAPQAEREAGQRAALRRHERWVIELRVLEYMECHRSGAYCVDVGDAVGVSHARAKGVLIRLAKAGVLETWMVPSPVSGNGRRFYKVAKS